MNKTLDADILIVGAGPVGLMCSYLANLCGLSSIVIDKSSAPLQVGRADALNARTLQLLEIAGLFEDIYPLGKACNTSSVWADGKFVSRQSSWWNELEGCFHKHFLMLGQSYLESLLDKKLDCLETPVMRNSRVTKVELLDEACRVHLESGKLLSARYLVGADGSRSLVRETFKIPFAIERPQIVWAVIDAMIKTDFKKVPEIIVFQNETSDVAWIPREGELDRFYVRMDKTEFSLDEAMQKVNVAMSPHKCEIKELVWFSQFSVKESVAETFDVNKRVFLAGDACHIHSVNGGQGLNTGLADAFNLIWKIQMVENNLASESLLETYQSERKPVAESVIESSGQLVRATRYSINGTHAKDYVSLVEKRSGNITGMGIRYGGDGLIGERLHDFQFRTARGQERIYSCLTYDKWTLIAFQKLDESLDPPEHIQVIEAIEVSDISAATRVKYSGKSLLVRPDGHIAAWASNLRAGDLLTQIRR